MGKNEGGEGGGKGNSSMVFNPSNERSGGGGGNWEGKKIYSKQSTEISEGGEAEG